MLTLSKTILVFPKDPSIAFLEPIITQAKETFHNIHVFSPSPEMFDLEVDDDVKLIIFLGHGSSSYLYGSANLSGEKTIFLSVDNASRVFQDTSIILLSCKSAEFIRNIKRNVPIVSYLGYGDMPTDWDHVSFMREYDSRYLVGFDEEHLFFYKEVLVAGFIKGLQLFSINNSSRSIFLGIQQTINFAINRTIFNKIWARDLKLQMVDLLCDLKSEIKYE